MKKFFSRKINLLIIAGLALALLLFFYVLFRGREVESPTIYDENNATYIPTPSPETATGKLHPITDMGGRVLRIVGWQNSTFDIFALGDTPVTHAAYLMQENARRVQREFNVIFDVTTFAYEDLLSNLDAADVIMLPGHMMLTAAMNEMILPICQINLPNSDVLGTNIFASTDNHGMGYVWAFRDNRPDLNTFALGVNLDIIAALEAQNPVDIYNNGLWTWDAMLDIMRSAVDGGYFGIAGQPFDFISQHSNALEFAETIFAEGLWHGENFDDWWNNSFAFLDGNAMFFPISVWMLNAFEPQFDFAVMPFPESRGPWRRGFVLPVNSEWEPADVLLIMEELFAWPGNDHGILMEDVSRLLPTDGDVARFYYVSKNVFSDVALTAP